jgi:hypothetical protein
MSWPQQRGDFTLPSPFGHLEIATFVPSSFDIESWTKSELHLAQLMLTPIPHFSQVYVAIAEVSYTQISLDVQCRYFKKPHPLSSGGPDALTRASLLRAMPGILGEHPHT